jgi:hypothetical protein
MPPNAPTPMSSLDRGVHAQETGFATNAARCHRNAGSYLIFQSKIVLLRNLAKRTHLIKQKQWADSPGRNLVGSSVGLFKQWAGLGLGRPDEMAGEDGVAWAIQRSVERGERRAGAGKRKIIKMFQRAMAGPKGVQTLAGNPILILLCDCLV